MKVQKIPWPLAIDNEQGIAYTECTEGAANKRFVPTKYVTRSNRWFATPGGYFFLLLQTLITRPITVTMSIQYWNRSEYVTMTPAPLSVVGGHKKTFSLRESAVGSRPLAVYR